MAEGRASVPARLDGLSELGQLGPCESHAGHSAHGAFGVGLATTVEGKGAEMFLDHVCFLNDALGYL